MTELEQKTIENPIVITEEEYQEAEESNQGICLTCRCQTHDFCEPDARQYECPDCEEKTVYGYPEALLCGFITF